MIRVGTGESIPDIANHDDDIGDVVPDVRIELPLLGGCVRFTCVNSVIFSCRTRCDALGDGKRGDQGCLSKNGPN